ncbi:MAG: large-conductance mechanosensitive channel protein MscL [Bacteroidales bacterium]|jgi:large conductance mechanosensitive channel|nr:large-conductance mechanosensitive channel protein MscL [Bacteroidales bacterium]
MKMNFLKEFKEFAMKGNLIDMAVAFVMGGAFGSFVTKFIEGIIMPLVGKITAGVDFNSLKIILSEAKVDASGKIIAAETAIIYGEFITACLNFVIIAFCMFLVIKAMNKMKRKNEELPAEPTPTEEQKLLTEIRDLLKK